MQKAPLSPTLSLEEFVLACLDVNLLDNVLRRHLSWAWALFRRGFLSQLYIYLALAPLVPGSEFFPIIPFKFQAAVSLPSLHRQNEAQSSWPEHFLENNPGRFRHLSSGLPWGHRNEFLWWRQKPRMCEPLPCHGCLREVPSSARPCPPEWAVKQVKQRTEPQC